MTGRIEARLQELGIALPEPAAPIANYIPFNVVGNLVVVSGQVPLRDGRIAHTGKLGGDVSLDADRFKRSAAVEHSGDRSGLTDQLDISAVGFAAANV